MFAGIQNKWRLKRLRCVSRFTPVERNRIGVLRAEQTCSGQTAHSVLDVIDVEPDRFDQRLYGPSTPDDHVNHKIAAGATGLHEG
jgi:hypothetical protein